MKKEKSFLEEFMVFLKEYKVISLAIAFIMGEASTGLVKSLVTDIILPLTAPLIAVETWKEAVIKIGPVTFSYGSFVADLLNFFILALIVFLVARKLIKMEKEGKK